MQTPHSLSVSFGIKINVSTSQKQKKSHVIFTEMTVYPLGPFLKHLSPILLHSLAAEDGSTDLVLSIEILGPKVRSLEPILKSVHSELYAGT